MARLFVVGDPKKLTPTLRAALEKESRRPKPIINITEFVFILSQVEENNLQIGLDNAKVLIAETLHARGITPNGRDAVLAKGNSVLYLAACVVIKEVTQGQTPSRVAPWGRGFKVHKGPLGQGKTVKSS